MLTILHNSRKRVQVSAPIKIGPIIGHRTHPKRILPLFFTVLHNYAISHKIDIAMKKCAIGVRHKVLWMLFLHSDSSTMTKRGSMWSFTQHHTSPCAQVTNHIREGLPRCIKHSPPPRIGHTFAHTLIISSMGRFRVMCIAFYLYCGAANQYPSSHCSQIWAKDVQMGPVWQMRLPEMSEGLQMRV